MSSLNNPPPDPLLPPTPPAPTPIEIPVSRPKSIVCDFCECKLAMDGGVLATGARAKRLAAHEDRQDSLTAEVESLRAQLTTVKEQLSARERELQEDAERSGPQHARF